MVGAAGKSYLWAEAGEQAGQKQMAMADQKAAMAVRPALTPFGGAIPVVRAAKAGQLEAKAASVPTVLAMIMATREQLSREDMEMKAGTAKTVVERPYRLEEKGGACPPLPVPAVAPPHCAASFFFWRAVD
jgi:hypothetical protein